MTQLCQISESLYQVCPLNLDPQDKSKSSIHIHREKYTFQVPSVTVKAESRPDNWRMLTGDETECKQIRAELDVALVDRRHQYWTSWDFLKKLFPPGFLAVFECCFRKRLRMNPYLNGKKYYTGAHVAAAPAMNSSMKPF